MSYKLKLKKPNVKHASKTAPRDLAVSNAKTLGIISLEPRILLDAAGFVTGAEVAMETLVSEDAQYGVDAIFEDGDITSVGPSEVETQHLELVNSLSQGDALAAAPVDGPWLGQDEAGIAPVDGPWLGQDEAGIAPVDGPWLGQDDTAVAPVDGPWL